MLRSLLGCLTISALSSAVSGLTVHVITHTHDDVGWLKTVDQYYTGLHNEIQHAMVQFVLDTVVDELGRNPNRTFSYVEQAFFQRWWRQQDDATKEKVKGMVKSKQLEFVNGGWCMHDEATTHFIDMIDQTTYGHSFIREESGEDALPTVNTQWDPFGHSATQGSLFGTAAGYDALFFGRMDHVDHDKRVTDKNLEFMWRPSRSQEASAQVFSFASLDGNYNPPGGLCFDYSCGDDPIQDDRRLNDYNLDQKVDIFVRAAMDYAATTKGDLDTMNVAFKMGSDFQYEAAHEWFINLDKLIDAVNRNGTVKALYSTPRRFMEAKNAEPVTFSVKTDDFFPYSDSVNGYWTGYFTSRPALKRYVRVSSNFLQIARHMEVFLGAVGNASEALWEAQSLAQHHDAVSGTEKQAVAYDYAQRIARGAILADDLIESSLATIATREGDHPVFSYCPLANTSICDASASGNLVVLVYNPQARPRNEIVFIPSASNQAKVVDAAGNPVASQILPAIVNTATTADSLPYRIAVNISTPGLGFNTVFVLRSSSEEAEQREEAPAPHKHDMHTMSRKRRARAVPPHIAERDGPKHEQVNAAPSIENSVLRLNFDSDSHLLTSITNKQTGETTPFAQDFAWYPAYQTPDPTLGWDSLDGAYVFRPNQQYANPLTSGVRLVSLNNGPLVSEAVQHVNPFVSQVIRLRQDYLIEFEWTVGPIDISDNQGKEIIIRYNTSLTSKGQFFTDANGREFQPRQRNYRETFPWINDQPIAGNYYPVNAVAYLADGDNALVVNVDRSQGASSIADGELEFMLHRRLCADDSKGVGEHLNEPGLDGKGLVVTGTHYVMLGPVRAATVLARQVQSRVYSESHVSYAQFDGDVTAYTKSHYAARSFLANALPPQVELITLQVMPENGGIAPPGSTLIRLAHMYGVTEALGQAVTIDLNSITPAPITAIKELSLTAGREFGSFTPMKWNVTDAGKTVDPIPLSGTKLTIQPNEVRTFAVTF